MIVGHGGHAIRAQGDRRCPGPIGCVIAILTFGPRSSIGFFLTPMSQANGWGRDVFALAIASFTYGGLLGGFSLALLWRRANQRDAITGMSIAIATMAIVVFAKRILGWFAARGLQDSVSWLEPLSRIAWPWYVLIGTTITLVMGILSSFTHPAPARSARP